MISDQVGNPNLEWERKNSNTHSSLDIDNNISLISDIQGFIAKDHNDILSNKDPLVANNNTNLVTKLPPKRRFAVSQKRNLEEAKGDDTYNNSTFSKDRVDFSHTRNVITELISKPIGSYIDNNRKEASRALDFEDGIDALLGASKHLGAEEISPLGLLSSFRDRLEHISKEYYDEDGEQEIYPRRGVKSSKLSVSHIQNYAEPRKPRIGPQYQAIVPPWTAPIVKK